MMLYRRWLSIVKCCFLKVDPCILDWNSSRSWISQWQELCRSARWRRPVVLLRRLRRRRPQRIARQTVWLAPTARTSPVRRCRLTGAPTRPCRTCSGWWRWAEMFATAREWSWRPETTRITAESCAMASRTCCPASLLSPISGSSVVADEVSVPDLLALPVCSRALGPVWNRSVL